MSSPRRPTDDVASVGAGSASAPPRAGRAGAWVWYLAAALVLALVVGVLWRTGGFARRTDVVSDVAVGAVVETGPFLLSFTSATAQQRTDTRGQVSWQVVVSGQGRTTGDTSLAPRTGDDGAFAARDPASGEVHPADGLQFRDGLAQFGGTFTPGLPDQPLAVTFVFGPDFRPGPTVVVGVWALELTDHSLLGNQEPSWNNGDRAFRYTLPLTELPAQIS